MKAMQLSSPALAESNPLHSVEMPPPRPAPHEISIRVHICGVCRTDLHIVEGEIPLPKLPVVPGHQIVGVVDSIGTEVTLFRPGDRVGVPWLFSTCGHCTYCVNRQENLCDHGRFTGYHVDGGFAEYVVVQDSFAYMLPVEFPDTETAPLLCAGVIGYRSLLLSGVKPGQRIGLYGFGASASIALQIIHHWKCEAYVFTRALHHQDRARELGAFWSGPVEAGVAGSLDAGVIFAPAGELVPLSLRHLRKGGTIALAGIHMSPIPEMEYRILYEERTIRSVANSTRDDVRTLLELASVIPLQTKVEEFPLHEANTALQKLKRSELDGSGVIRL